MMAAELEQVTVPGYRGNTFTVGDTVTVEGSPGVWRIAGFFGRPERSGGDFGFGSRPLIADLVRIDRKWTAATSAYITLLRAVA